MDAELLHIAKVLKLLLSFDSPMKGFREFQWSSVKIMCRWIEKLLDPAVSEAAVREAAKKGFSERHLRETRWAEQERRLLDPGRKVFHMEHVLPVSDIAKRVVEARNDSVERIAEILATSKVAWITKDENRKLDKGNRFNRLDPENVYRECGIKLL